MKECHHVTKLNSSADGKKVGWFPFCFSFCVFYTLSSVLTGKWRICSWKAQNLFQIPLGDLYVFCSHWCCDIYLIYTSLAYKLRQYYIFFKCYSFLVYVDVHYFVFIETLFNTFDKSLLKTVFVTVRIKWTTNNPYTQIHL